MRNLTTCNFKFSIVCHSPTLDIHQYNRICNAFKEIYAEISYARNRKYKIFKCCQYIILNCTLSLRAQSEVDVNTEKDNEMHPTP
jgi:hypothetical protein